MLFFHLFLALVGALPILAASPFTASRVKANSIRADMATSQNKGNRLVFCHFMIGVVSNRKKASDYDDDMKRAKDAGIDAFALNIGTDDYTDTQLAFAYQSAADNNMKVFISFDFNWWKTSDNAAVGAKTKKFASQPAQLQVDGKVFVSSFAGDGVDVNAVKAAAGSDIYFAPNFHPGQGDFSNIDAALNWVAWDSDGNNKAPTAEKRVTVLEGDISYNKSLAGKPLIAPASPWFSTHFGSEVSYSKNWVFPSDLLWYERWREILKTGPRFVEIITWNDYGESHYIGPLSSPHTDDGNSKWVMDMPHNGWLDMAKPFIAAYKAGKQEPLDYLKEEKLVYWYRPTPKAVDCDATDTTMQGGADNSTGNFFAGRPNGVDSMSDEVFVVAMLKEAATLRVTVGQVDQTFNAEPGVWPYRVQMDVGKVSFEVTRNGKRVDSLSGQSLKDISNECPCGIYNFNAYVGTLPAESTLDQLLPEGMTMLEKGLKVSCPKNTLGTNKPSASSTASLAPSQAPSQTPTQAPSQTPTQAPSQIPDPTHVPVTVTVTVTKEAPAPSQSCACCSMM